MHKIITTTWHTHSTALSDIRTRVFIEEQRVPVNDEWDGLDETAVHFLMQYQGQAIGCARLLIEEYGGEKYFHIGRVALLKAFRAQGLGYQMMEFILDYCRATAPYPIYLHAQIERRTFYERLGFVARGLEFIDAGIPHIAMYWQPTERNHG